ncbi:MAG: hypothetical protein ACTHMV_04880 [Chitinophagaceae bacterium]
MSSLRDKMLNYETAPPQGVWDRIAAALDEAQQGDQFPGRLRSMEVTPPAMAWENIAASLDEEAKPVPQPFRIPAFLRYAAAAVVIGAVAFAILRWTGNTDRNTSGTASATQPDSGQTNNNAVARTTPEDTQKAISPEPDEDDAVVLEQSKKLMAKLDRPSRPRKSNPVTYPVASKASSAIYTYNDHVPSIADRYIMLMTPDGNIIRMSKKLGNLVCCVSGEDPDAGCKDQLKKWQEKMATSSLTTSAGNFMDILNLVSSLDEGTDL